MPELPEVETIRRQIVSEINFANTIVGVDWTQLFVGANVSTPLGGIVRKGKSLCLYGRQFKVYLHLRMSGRLHIMRSMEPAIDSILSAFKHVKAIFSFSSSTGDFEPFRVVFTDTRGFGICEVTAQNPLQPKEHPKIKELGIDPLYKDEWTSSEFFKRIKGSNLPIATTLLDQSIIAGIGNIYRSEILHAAKISPYRKATTLEDPEIGRIKDWTDIILHAAIKARGTSMKDHRSSYRDLYGNPGEFQDQLKVYQREYSKCLRPNCGGVIAFADLEKNRRIYWCSRCQN